MDNINGSWLGVWCKYVDKVPGRIWREDTSYSCNLHRYSFRLGGIHKELFQGQGKGFDVEKALSAPSVREFEQSISMVSYGIDSIEQFYATCSTRDVVGKVKIPVLFIQNDDSKVPLFSIPRSMIAENPFTSLLLCSHSSRNSMGSRLRFSWCQSLTLEWLTAVELGLLKGRHPLLNDVDVTINPSRGLALVERKSNKRGKSDKLLNQANGNSPLTIFEENGTGTSILSRPMKGTREPPGISKGLPKEDRNVGNHSSASIDAATEDNGSDNERGQVLQTAQVVMNMLDVTMPGTLSDEEKMKVLNAVGQGETLVKALQDAVPEDVRGKLTAAVSGIMQSQGSNVKFDKLLNLGNFPDVASGLNSKFLEKMRKTKANGDGDVSSLGKRVTANSPEDGSLKSDHNSDKPSGDTDSEKQSLDTPPKPSDSGTDQSTSDQGSNNPNLEKGILNEGSEDEQFLGGRSAQTFDKKSAPEIKADGEVSSMLGPSESNGTVSDQTGVEKRDGKDHSGSMEENNVQKNDFSSDHHESGSHGIEDEHSAPSSPSEAQITGNEAESSQSKQGSCPKPLQSESNNSTPHFSVSEALDALTGFDDSTQAAVNSVFNVIEGVIDQLDVEKNSEDHNAEDKGSEDVKERSEGSVAKNDLTNNDSESAKTSDLRSNDNAQSDKSEGAILYDPEGASYKYEQQNSASHSDSRRGQLGTEYETSFVPATGKHPEKDFIKYLNASVPGRLTLPYDDPLYKEYLKTYRNWMTRNAQPFDVAKKSTLHLDYIPEEGKWKLLDQTEDNSAYISEDDYREDLNVPHQRSKHIDTVVEPSYVILDSSIPPDRSQDSKADVVLNNDFGCNATKIEDSILFVKTIILKCLIVEVGRRVNAVDTEEMELRLAGEMEYVANSVSEEAGKENIHMCVGSDTIQEKLGTLHGEKIVRVISSALQETQFLKRILPVGVVVGSSLAALRKFFDVAALDCNEENFLPIEDAGISTDRFVQVHEKETSPILLNKREHKDCPSNSIVKEGDNSDHQSSNNKNEVMVGAVTAALGASALLVHQQNTETAQTSKDPLSDQQSAGLSQTPEKTHNIVTSLAEKALSVASPVVPLKEDGGVDQERLVNMLAELGQRGGILKLVGKVALLWGGIRGAMSLTDKLISFLHIAERPLFQRILGFVSMVLLLWSPVVIPMLPTLMQNWSTQSHFKIAEFACIASLYVSVLIMIALWGKRIRKYDDPLLQYGMDLASVPKLENFLKGLIGGFILVVSIHAVNSSLGFAHLRWPDALSSSSSEPVALIKAYAWMLIKVVKGIATATAVSVVEELLFRSWLPEEIASDYGYHQGIIISGLIFALSQRSMWEIPGLLLLSLSLSGARQRNEGGLSLPIGLRTGILASNFMLKSGGFLSYRPNLETWVTGGHPFQPFSGVVGLAFSFVLAVILYPRQALYNKNTRPIRG
ncbi:uncharacterized protein LOC127251464 isoform X2 [Andrographis paniculata]|uniref:uncharacterized protein LOC127251464 isoform X2 n=1 Tax=Andrographis paniculata TaxID=175694 RepID=UPI0021E959A6|nr:uncharacterized protein LOC127251464 isoform X2 [Andrographis paniculata]